MINKKEKQQLEMLLAKADNQDDVFSLNELIGFLYGLAITPEMIAPSEWLPVVFGEEMFTVDSEKQALGFIDTLMRVYNRFTDQFQNGWLTFPFDLTKLAGPDDLDEFQEWVFRL